MNRNTAYLFGLWGIVGVLMMLVFGWFLFGTITTLRQGQAQYAVTIPLAIVIAVAFVIYTRRSQAEKVRRLLQSRSAGPLICFLKRTIRPGLIPNGDAVLAHSCAMIYTLYGNYTEALSELDSVDWSDRPPMFVAMRKGVEAWLCFLDTREYARGLMLAKSAAELAEIAPAIPGATQAVAAHNMLVQIGGVLNNQFSTATVETLEQTFQQMQIVGQLQVAWGLAHAYRKLGNVEEATSLEKFIHETAPHCHALHAQKKPAQ